MATYKVGYFVGSLSSKSINRILSRAPFGWRRMIWSSPRYLSAICRSTVRTSTTTTLPKQLP
jgi:hypothetical protein